MNTWPLIETSFIFLPIRTRISIGSASVGVFDFVASRFGVSSARPQETTPPVMNKPVSKYKLSAIHRIGFGKGY